MTNNKFLKLPAQYILNERIGHANQILQLRQKETELEASVIPFIKDRVRGLLVEKENRKIFVSDRESDLPTGANEHLILKRHTVLANTLDFSATELTPKWNLPVLLPISEKSLVEWEKYCAEICNTWKGKVQLVEERRNQDNPVKGLRPPQIGALYSILSHWTVSSDAATVTLPTGTGKTDTMVTLLVSQQIERVLIVVPTDALREQTANKFITLSFLKEFGILAKEAQFPVVGILKNIPKNIEEVDEIFRRCNVIVTTMSVAGQCSDEVQQRMSTLCSHLFVDEAHHVPATKWNAFRGKFLGKKIVQFTATPFRTDGRVVEGKIVFNYPLGKAQQEGYFRPITFVPVIEYVPTMGDRAIAIAAIKQLDDDISKNLDHIVMARASGVARAEEVLTLYKELGGKYNPVLLHSSLRKEQKSQAMNSIFSRQSRIIVCVDMLGEGFDLPELKIAALHDVHKSLAITLQFTGRFTRVKPELGDATVIANIADQKVEESLTQLYSEDPDWNVILKRLSEGATEKQIQKAEFLNSFTGEPNKLVLQNIFPKMSTVVYRTKCEEWKPSDLRIETYKVSIHTPPTINQKDRLMLYTTREIDEIDWGQICELINIEWHLYIIHWDKDSNLLYIHSSNTKSDHRSIARSVAGADSMLISGEQIFRILHGINRFMLTNLGLSHLLSNSVRFSMHAGADVGTGLTESHGQNKIKSNLFGRGYSEGRKVSIGATRKGRIWSHQVAGDISEWVVWCKRMGSKLNDNTISTDVVLKSIILPVQITERPSLVPIAIEWPEYFYEFSEDAILFHFNDNTTRSLLEVELEVIDRSSTGPLRFLVSSEGFAIEYQMKFLNGEVSYISTGRDIEVTIGRKKMKLSDVFEDASPIVRFENGSFQIDSDLFELPKINADAFFAQDRMHAIDWTGINLKRESQTYLKHPDSIQRRMLNLIVEQEDPRVQVILDDDGKGEAADIVTFGVKNERVYISFYHCKYSGDERPGARIDDLYEVCGQTQKSIHWRSDPEGLILHLLKRNAKRVEKTNVSGFELGDEKSLNGFLRCVRMMEITFQVYIVQPGLSKSQASDAQREILAVTELYLKETYAIDLGVICSD